MNRSVSGVLRILPLTLPLATVSCATTTETSGGAASALAPLPESGGPAISAGGENLRARPRRRAVNQAWEGVSARATACLAPTDAPVRVSGAFEGTSGRFQVATVDPAPAASVDACIRDAAREARVPAFRDPRFEAVFDVAPPAPASGPSDTTTLSAVLSTEPTPAPAPTATSAPATPTATATATATPTATATATPTPTATPTATATPPAPSAEPSPAPPAALVAGAQGSESGNLTGGSVGGASTGADTQRLADVMRGRASDFRACYAQRLAQDPSLHLRVRARFTVLPAGRAGAVSSTTTLLDGEEELAAQVAACVEDVIRGVGFEPRAAPLAVVLPFTFAPGAGAGAPPAASSPPLGRVDAAAVGRAVQARGADVRTCYAHAIATDPALAGTVRVRFRIDPQGRVSDTSSSVQLRGGENASLLSVARCVERLLRETAMPGATGGDAEVAVPFDFEPRGNR